VFSSLAKRRADVSQDLNDALPTIRALDIEAFRKLVDPEEEEFLRARLSLPEFRKIKRERSQAALAYVKTLSEVALQFTRFGSAAQDNPNPALAALGRQIASSGTYLRLRTLDANLRLRVAIAFPGLPARPLRSLLNQYDHAASLLLNHNGLSRSQARSS
jgi:hypothetical protein